MESDAVGTSGIKVSPEGSQALNSTILDYYKKFGRKRDLEQYFSLNTAQGDIKDVSSLFWRRMKSQESSDSGEKSVDTSLEICRIQIKCSSVDQEPEDSQDDNTRPKSDSVSPPIITEEVIKPSQERESDNDDDKSVKSDDNHSQKSNDAILDTSINKAYSPSSSITSQRKLEWDSLADVGYANESDKRTTASTLSTLERLALQQQYSNNDTHQSNPMGPPTAHSTPVEEADMKSKGKKGKSTKIYTKDVECVEVNVPQCSDANPQQSINVNLTKHISFSVDKSGGVSVGNVKKDYSVSPEKNCKEIKPLTHETEDKEIQTSLIKTKDKSSSSGEIPRPLHLYGQGVPVLINLNNLKKRQRRRKVSAARKKLRTKRKIDADKENVPVLEKSGEQVSDAESFEYMPGHIYNQNHMNKDPPPSNQTAGNKSSLESSGALTTDSSKGSKHSFTKDLENGIKLLRSALKNRYDDAELKQRLIKEVVQKLIKSNYRDDETSTEFLSGLSFSSKKLGIGEGNNTTTSTSDANNTAEKAKLARPKKSILRVDKFNANAIASTSQSAPNLPTVSNSDNPIFTNFSKVLTTTNSLSDTSSKEKTSSDTAFAKTSSEELYKKYLDALRREEAYKKHLRDKEQFLKQKLVASETAVRSTLAGPAARLDVRSRLKLKDLMKDLTRNNYDDGSGDASKLEGGFISDVGLRSVEGKDQRRHSVFTLSSSGNSDHSRKSNLKKSAMKDIPKAGHSKDEKHYCCCPHHSVNKIGVTDSSVQVNIRCEDGACLQQNDNITNRPRSSAYVKPVTRIVSDERTGEIKYLCLCNAEGTEVESPPDNFLIYKCSRLRKDCCCDMPHIPKPTIDHEDAKHTKSSQTCIKIPESNMKQKEIICIHEAVRVTQTDISINPRISDPSLSDIKITKDSDCVKLIREQFREVSKTSVDSDMNLEQNAARAGVEIYEQPSTSSTFSNRRKKENTNIITAHVETQSDINLQERETIPKLSSIDAEGYTIPIQGTNMSLKVCVGSNPVRNMEVFDSRNLSRPIDTRDVDVKEVMEKAKRSNAVVTDRVGTVENTTSITEECSKGVQSENKGLFSQYDRKTGAINTIYTEPELFHAQSNPSNKSRLQRKPFLRSNTFDGVKERNSAIRNEVLDDFYEREHWATYPNTSTYGRPLPDFPKQKVDSSCDPIYPEAQEGADSDSSQNELYDVVSNEYVPPYIEPLKLVDSSCDPTDEIDLDPCPCPEHSECGNTCGKHAECRIKKLIEQQHVIEERNEADSSEFVPPVDVKTKVNAACGPSNKLEVEHIPEKKGEDNSSNDEIEYNQNNTRKPCPCPVPSECGNYCPKNADCWRQRMEENTARKKCVSRESKDGTNYTRSKTRKPCPCPMPSECGNYCSEDADCWNKKKEGKKCVTGRSNDDSNYTHSKIKKPCPCPMPSECGNYCSEDADCWNKRKEDKTVRQKSLTLKNNESDGSNDETDNTPSRTRKPCPCPMPSECGNYCPENADCWSKNKLTLSEKPISPRNFPHGDSQPENSDSDFLDFKKLKDYLRSQSHPSQSKKSSAVSGSSLPHSRKLESVPSKILTTDSGDLIMNVIKDVTDRYTKKDLERGEKKKCFKEIVSILNYLLDTEDNANIEAIKGLKNLVASNTGSDNSVKTKRDKTNCKTSTSKGTVTCNLKEKDDERLDKPNKDCCKKTTCDRGVQSSIKKYKPAKCCPESSDLQTTSDMPCTSSDSVTCKVLSKIRNECDKYHRKCCKCHQIPKRCQCSSTTSMSCDQCRQIIFCPCMPAISANCEKCKLVHHCQCRSNNRCKCKGHRQKIVSEKLKKKCIAYNLILQTSESMLCENIEKNGRHLKNIIVKVPPRRPSTCNIPFREMECKIGKQYSPRSVGRSHRSKSLPTDSISSTDDGVKGTAFTVKDYLEKNRPDFIEQTSHRQKCLKMIREARANNRSAQRELLSMQVQVEPTLRGLSESDLRALAAELGLDRRRRKEPPKLISEREMKNHSKKIYKKLPEQLQKKEDLKKENIKKTNLLLASIFKKNLQKKALKGSVNLSNYSTVIKI